MAKKKEKHLIDVIIGNVLKLKYIETVKGKSFLENALTIAKAEYEGYKKVF